MVKVLNKNWVSECMLDIPTHVNKLSNFALLNSASQNA